MAKWRSESEAQALIARANALLDTGDDAGFVKGSFTVSEFALILSGLLELSSEIPETQRSQIASKASFEVGNRQLQSLATVLARCAELEREYLSQAKLEYRLLTEVSIAPTLVIPATRFGETTLTFSPKTLKGFSLRRDLFESHRRSLGFELPSHYQRLAARVSARSAAEAFEKALEAIDVVRGTWNLSLNRGKAWRHSGGRPAPINDIRLSPYHTLHKLDGALAEPAGWYEPGYSRLGKIFSDRDKLPRLLKFGETLRELLRVHQYRGDMQSALLRYVRALDSCDMNDAFLRLWSVLEHLTDGTNSPYKVAVRRAAFHFADHARATLVLNHLTSYRNRYVHVGADSQEIETLLFLLKRHVDQLMLFHLQNPFDLESRQEAAAFMDLPNNRAEIDRRLRRLRHARRYISPRAA